MFLTAAVHSLNVRLDVSFAGELYVTNWTLVPNVVMGRTYVPLKAAFLG